MQEFKPFITKAIENHILDTDHLDYEDIEKIIDKKELKQLSFYLESEQDEKFDKLLKELLTNKSIKSDISELIKKELKRDALVTKDFSVKNEDGQTCTVFYGTNREPNEITDLSKGYGNDRANKLHLGSCTVNVPYDRKKGELKGSFWQKIKHFNASYGDVELKTLKGYEADNFWKTISALLKPLEPEEQQALVFIHGFNNSFEESAIRATQISVDLEHTGVTAFFSWASKAKALSYISDSATIQYSEKYLTEFLTDFAKKSGAKRIHIIAHSMGNRALLEAVNRINRNNPEIQFGQIILAAPDVDADVFKELSITYPKLSEQTTLYISKKDKAVGMSKWLHSHNRAGFTPPVCIVEQINTIEVEENVNLLELGHGYFAEQTSLLEDMKKLIKLNLDANNRDTLRLQKVTINDRYWKLTGE